MKYGCTHGALRAGQPSGSSGPPVLTPAAAAGVTVQHTALAVSIEDSDSDIVQDDGTFDGASGPARMKPDLWVCKECKGTFPLVSWMANVRVDDKSFFYLKDKLLTTILEREAEFQNLYQAGSVMLVCPYCCEKWHGETYVNRKDPERHRLAERYKRKAMNSRGNKMQASRVAWVCKQADRGNPDAEGVPYSEVYRQLASSQQVRKSTDFIYVLSPWCTLFYGCDYCQIVPLRSCSWYRTVRAASELREGLTEASGGRSHKPAAHWRCGNCLEEWTWRQGAKRVFAIGDVGDDGETDLKSCTYAYIGVIPQSLENRINFIKACVLLKQINGRTIDKEMLLRAIAEVNALIENRFKRLEEAEVFTAKDPQEHDYFKWCGAKILCEDPRLSLASPGQSFKGVNLRRARNPPLELTPDEVEFLVDTIAGALDIESVGTKSGTKTHKLEEYSGFADL